MSNKRKKEKNQNDNTGFIFAGLVGITLIILGIVLTVRSAGWLRTIGTYTNTEEVETRDSDGNRSHYFLWHYSFYLDDIEYTAVSSNQSVKFPRKNEEVILYNQFDPRENKVLSDKSNYVYIVFGTVFLSIPLFYGNFRNKKIDKKEKDFRDAWFVIFFGIALLLIMLLSINFELFYIFSVLPLI